MHVHLFQCGLNFSFFTIIFVFLEEEKSRLYTSRSLRRTLRAQWNVKPHSEYVLQTYDDQKNSRGFVKLNDWYALLLLLLYFRDNKSQHIVRPCANRLQYTINQITRMRLQFILSFFFLFILLNLDRLPFSGDSRGHIICSNRVDILYMYTFTCGVTRDYMQRSSSKCHG